MKGHLQWMVLLFIPFSPLMVAENGELNKQPVSQLDSGLLLNFLQNQLKALHEGDVAKAYNDFTSGDFKRATSLEAFEQFVKHFEVLSKNKSLLIYAMYFENNRGTLRGLLTSDAGESYKVEYDLIEEDGNWKIMGIQLFKSSTQP